MSLGAMVTDYVVVLIGVNGEFPLAAQRDYLIGALSLHSLVLIVTC